MESQLDRTQVDGPYFRPEVWIVDTENDSIYCKETEVKEQTILPKYYPRWHIQVLF